jgi:hypothetical protein
VVKPAECRVCGGPLEQRPVGRPRMVCSQPACQRQAEADSRRLRRRRLAGIAPSWQYDTPQPRGGHDPIARRIARKLAADYFPHVQPTVEEVAALEATVRLGATPLSLAVTSTSMIRGIPAGVTEEERRVLHQLVERNHEVAIVGKLPEHEQTDEPADQSWA